ncbi:polysaccharide lyase family 8 super-sandwich domain-containing protein [Paenibacillus sp. FSL K6-2524]|uniref:polysaccharide lyase family 8 super-sandwich domain-containing protein n=1 Tax=Paenibacillus sp. FSL K6-2524 TaxID=2954516 RepID=UPI0030FB6C3A
MRKYKIKIFVSFLMIFSLIFTSFPVAPVSAAQLGQGDEFDALRLKWFNYLTGGMQIDLNDGDIRGSVEANALKVTNDNKSGVWDTLNKATGRTYLWSDYNSTTNSSHITLSYNRLKDMAIAFATPGTDLYRNEVLKNDIIAGLDWMHENRYNTTRATYNNWWDWEIGSPQSVADIVTLMYNDLTAEQIAGYTSTIDRFIPDPTKRLIGAPGLKETGANLLDKSLALLLRGVLGKDEAIIVQARGAISSVFPYVTSGDGFYMDGSFIQHGNIAYTGSYGSVLLGDVSKLLTVLNGSSWPIEVSDFGNVWKWVTDSFEPVIYNGHIMEMVSGRAVSRFNNNTRGGVWTILRLAQFAPPDQAAYYKSMVKEWVVSDTSMPNMYEGMQIRDIVNFKQLMNDSNVKLRGDLIAHRQFSVMDRIVHSRKGYTFGISMSSSRISNFEGGMNSEHTRGWYTGDGMTYLYNQDADQFRNGFWPTVDSYRMPGTTSDGLERTMIKTTGKNWVGGSSIDNQFGVAGMDMAPPGSKLTGKKSWFMFDDEIVALGTDIKTPDARKDGREVETIVENRMINTAGTNKLTVDGRVMPTELGWSKELKGVKWAHLEGTAEGADIGYYFPDSADVGAMREARTGSWKEINATGPADPITRNYVSLVMEHGVLPKDGGYSYVLLPSFNSAATQAYNANPDIRVLSNTAQIQAVQETKLGITGINFWQPGELDRVRVYQPASVMVKEQGDELTVSVSDPTQTQSKVKVEIAAVALAELAKDSTVKVLQTAPTIQLEVDTQGAKGRSHVIKLKIDPEAETELPGEGALEPDAAAKVRINVTEDTFVNGGGDENTNFGTRGFLNIRNGSGTYDRRVFLKFDLSQIIDEVEKVTLHVYGQTKDSNGTQSDIGVFEIDDDSWKEDTITYKNKPAAGERIDLQTIASPDQWWQFNVTPFAKFKLQGNKTVSLALQQVGRDLSAEMRSRKNEGGQFGSYLEVLLKDTIAPTTTVQIEGDGETEGEYYKDVTLMFSAEDNPHGWGVLRTEARIDGGKWKSVKDGKLAIQGEGTHNVEFRSVDKAGNVEETKVIVVSVTRPTVELSGPSEVTAGEPLLVKYGIKTSMKDLYANHFALAYDENLLEFVSAKSLQEGISILDTRKDKGQVQLVIAGEGQPIQGNADMLKLTFKTANVTATTEGKLNIIRASMGNQQGNEIETAPTSVTFSVKVKEEKPNVEEPDPGNGSGSTGNSGPGTNPSDSGKASIHDLNSIAKYFGMTLTNANWDQMKAMDVNGDGKIDVLDLAAMARKIPVPNSDKLPVQSQGMTSYHLNADKTVWKAGDTVKLNLTGKNVRDLYAYELKLSYDSAHLEFVEASSKLKGFTVSPMVKDGEITFIHTMMGNTDGADGDLELGSLTFKIKKAGASEVRWDALTTVDHKLEAEVTAIGQSVRLGEPEHDKAVALKDTKGHWAEAIISQAVGEGLINGYPDETFRPDQRITRAEFTALLVRGLALKEEAELSFTDAAQLPKWAKSDIAKGIKKGFINGFPDHTFRANQSITRTELTVMAAKALDSSEGSKTVLAFADTGDIPVWAQGWIASAVNEGLVQGRNGNRFAPLEQATRAEAIVVVMHLLEARMLR